MRHIRTAEVQAREVKTKKIIVGIVLISLMVVSTAGYSLMQGNSNDNSKVKENGLMFYRQNGIWKTSVDGEVFGFQYLPSEIVNVSVEGYYDLGMYANQLLYYTSPSEGVIEILNNIGRYTLRYQGACLNETNETTCEDDLPTKDCWSNVIVTGAGNETRVYSNQSCVYLVGDSVKAADAFLYKVLKIN